MYLDIYFLINLILDRCSLECALRKYRLPGWRLWIGAVVGAIGACLWEVAEIMELSPVIRPIWALILAILMVYVCIGGRPGKQWFKALTEVYGFSFLFAGVIPFVGQFMPLWLGSVLLSYAMIQLWLKWQEKKTAAVLELQVETDTLVWKMNAMVDTGHRLKEPITGSPVVIMKAESLPEGVQPQWPVCFESVQGSGVMLGFWPKNLKIGNRLYKEKEILVAVAPEWKGKSYEALIPGYMMEQL